MGNGGRHCRGRIGGEGRKGSVALLLFLVPGGNVQDCKKIVNQWLGSKELHADFSTTGRFRRLGSDESGAIAPVCS